MERTVSKPETYAIVLRDVRTSDLPLFFEQQLDPEVNWMTAFTSRNPEERDVFMGHWNKILEDETINIQTILFNGQVVGHILGYEDEEFNGPEVSYWIGKSYWGKGIIHL